MSQESEISLEAPSWIGWFCGLEEHQYFAEVDPEFAADPFNHFELKERFPNFKELLHLVLRPFPPEEEELENEYFAKLHEQATQLYGLLHVRFILSPLGMGIMREKFLQGRFGTCPKIYCEDQKVLPIGLSEHLKTSRVKLYCPRCKEVYHPKRKHSDVDGAYFGPSFPHVLLKNFTDLKPVKKVEQFVPKIFGFVVREGQDPKDPKETKETKEKSQPNPERLKLGLSKSPGKWEGKGRKTDRAKGKQNL